jgi:hypothetical protein
VQGNPEEQNWWLALNSSPFFQRFKKNSFLFLSPRNASSSSDSNSEENSRTPVHFWFL